MRYTLLVICVCFGLILFAQKKMELDFVQFKMKADSISGIIDSNVQLLYKKQIVGVLEDFDFKGEVYINSETREIHKAVYAESTQEEKYRSRVFYYYKTNLVKMLLSDSSYYPFRDRVLNSMGNIINESFSDNILGFEKTARELVLKLQI